MEDWGPMEQQVSLVTLLDPTSDAKHKQAVPRE